jgi:hypothetical protein
MTNFRYVPRSAYVTAGKYGGNGCRKRAIEAEWRIRRAWT